MALVGVHRGVGVGFFQEAGGDEVVGGIAVAVDEALLVSVVDGRGHAAHQIGAPGV